jgi:hypothetical protein
MSLKQLRLPVLVKLRGPYPLQSVRSLRDISTDLPAKQVVVPTGDYGRLRKDLEKFFRRLGSAYDPAE